LEECKSNIRHCFTIGGWVSRDEKRRFVLDPPQLPTSTKNATMMTTTEKIKQTFDPFFDAPLEVWTSFADIGEIINTTKDQIIKKGETTEKYLYFVLNGCGGILLWKNNNYVCLDLCFEGDFFGDYVFT
jgi:hypothetical protein